MLRTQCGEPQVCESLTQHASCLLCHADVKWRYFWRVGPRPQQTEYAELNAEPVVPQVRFEQDWLVLLLIRHASKAC